MDEIDQLLVTQVAAPTVAPTPTGMPAHGPRDYSDEELGIASAPQVGNAPGRGMGGYPGRPTHTTDPMEVDTTAQNVVASVLAGGAGRLVGPVLGKLGPVVGHAGTNAVEGAVASKETGGSALAGGALGALTGGVSGTLEGAPGRVRARALKDVVQGEGEGAKPTKSLVRKLAARAGEEGDRLGEVLDEDPALEHTLSTAAARHPKEALDAVQKTIERNDTRNGPVYQAITDAGGVKLTDVVSPMQKLRQGYVESGKTAAAEAVQREIDSLVKNYGGEKAENAVLSGKQLQGVRNEIGAAAFDATPMASRALKTQVKRDLYGAYRDAIEGAAGQLEDLAPGVSLDNFRARNKSTSVLIPMRDVLKERAANEQVGAKSFAGRLREAAPEMLAGGMLGEGVHLAGGGLKEAALAALATKVIPSAGRGVAQLGRHVDYGLSRVAHGLGEGERGAGHAVVRGQVEGATANQLSPEDAVRAATLAQGAKAGVPSSRLINGVRLFGRPATAEERTAAGLPASLEHALNTNDPTLGHAALRHEVFGQ